MFAHPRPGAGTDMPVQLQSAVKRAVPRTHRVMVQPDCLSLDVQHPLLGDAREQRLQAVWVVIAPNQMNVSATDALADSGRFSGRAGKNRLGSTARPRA